MKKLLLSIIALLGISLGAAAATLSSQSWSQVCSGSMGSEWYSSAEAQSVADIVLSVQKTNGGWMKNDQLHKLSASELSTLKNARTEHSCLDNYATTQEMRFLAKVYQGTKVEKYRTAFNNAIKMILTAEKQCGGWSQYWPLSGNGSYQDYITFNDDLVTNVMKILRDIYTNKGDFTDMVDENCRERCRAAFNRGLDMIIRCQIDDNGTKAAWCAQHDTIDFLPTEGRPHELPSVSAYESASLLSFLMTVEKPSAELQECISSAIQWLDAHKIVGKAIEDYTNANGQSDRHIIDKAGSAIWGRFIQIGGESGKKVYDKFFTKLKNRNKSRSYIYNGTKYTYTEYQIATSSYDASKAYEPIFAIYTDELPHLYYRFLYNYEDTDPIPDSKGLPIATSLTPGNRSSYQYLGSWCLNTINTEYPAWKQKIDMQNAAGDTEIIELSQATYSSEDKTNGNTYIFSNGFTITNAKGKAYGAGQNGTIKYSANDYTIHIPADKKVVKVTFYGYDNYDSDAYLSNCNGTKFTSTQYVFPAKESSPVFTSHTLDFTDKPATGSMTFGIGSKQCCLMITLNCIPAATDVNGIAEETTSSKIRKEMHNGKVVINNNGILYNIAGQQFNK